MQQNPAYLQRNQFWALMLAGAAGHTYGAAGIWHMATPEEHGNWGGGCDTRSILPHAKPDEVRQHVREQIEIMKTGGGFVFQQVHNIQADVPVENIVAMFEAVKK
jgi:hypothetical protein